MLYMFWRAPLSAMAVGSSVSGVGVGWSIWDRSDCVYLRGCLARRWASYSSVPRGMFHELADGSLGKMSWYYWLAVSSIWEYVCVKTMVWPVAVIDKCGVTVVRGD